MNSAPDYIKDELLESICANYRENNQIRNELFTRYGVKRGLRNSDGTGVLAGITQVGYGAGYVLHVGVGVPWHGGLSDRG